MLTTMMRLTTALLFWLNSFAPVATADEPPPFELKDGDRVVFVGNTFIERDQVYGYLETMLTARWPDRNITFRNLGWSGDTVWGEARAGFDSPAEGYKRLLEQTKSAKPTVIFVGYGNNESFEGESGLKRFLDGLEKLLDEFKKTAAKLIVLSPTQFEDVGQPLLNASLQNRNRMLYTEGMQVLCTIRGFDFVDVFTGTRGNGRPELKPRTDNGVHLTPDGYWCFAAQVIHALRITPYHSSQVIYRGDGVSLESFEDVEIEDFERTENSFRFNVRFVCPPVLPMVQIFDRNSFESTRRIRRLLIRKLPPHRFELRVDGTRVGNAPLQGNPNAVQLLFMPNDLDVEQSEQLRRTIIEKNRLFFHRWRPQNETYLFGFRKHEQGNNAAEVPKFDPLVEEMEAKIAKLRVPRKHTYELIRQD